MTPLDQALAAHVSLLSLLPRLWQAAVLGALTVAAWRLCTWIDRLPKDKEGWR